MKTSKIHSHVKLIFLATVLLGSSMLKAYNPSFDSDKSVPIFNHEYHQVFNPTSGWDNATFYSQWQTAEANCFNATDIANGYLQYIWTPKRMMFSLYNYCGPYVFESKIDYSAGSNRGGVVIRFVQGPAGYDVLQEPGSGNDPGFNRVGVAFYPKDADNFYVQVSGTENGGATPRMPVAIPKPAGITSFMSGVNTLRVEDFGNVIYAYMNNLPLCKVNLSALTSPNNFGMVAYTSGTVYDADMNQLAVFNGMEIPVTGKIAIAERDANLRVYEVKVQSVHQDITFDKPLPTTNTLYEMNGSSTFNQTEFNAQWDIADSFSASNTSPTFWSLAWVGSRCLQSKNTYNYPYIYDLNSSLTNPAARGGMIIRIPASNSANDLQEPGQITTNPLFNRSGLAFFPTEDGSSLIVQTSGVINGFSTPYTRIYVKAPLGVNLRNAGITSVEDYGKSIYVFYNDQSICKINFDNTSTELNASGSVFDANMILQGKFSGMHIPFSNFKLGAAIRQEAISNDVMRIYNIAISSAIVAPDAPSNLIATAGNSKASIAFTAPASNGGSAILDYTVTSSPGGITETGTSSPIKVTGLSNGTAYTFTVTARNAIGSSTESAASASVTPNATAYIIPVSGTTNISTLTLTPVSDVVVSSNKLTINAATTLNSITVAPGAELELSSGQTLTAGSVTLQSDATGTATLVDNTTNAPQAITATVQQYVEAGRNWYMSIPLASGTSSLLNRGTSVVCYDEPSGTWIAPASNTLNKLRGYVQVATSTPSTTGTTGTVDFTGVVNTGAHSINLSRTVGKTGFNLVGNPYPSYLDWNMVTRTNVLPTMWYRTKEGGVYKFYTFVANGSAGVGSPASVTNKIPPMQAFWVRVATEGTGNIAVDNNMRSHKDLSGNIMKAPSQTPQQLIRLQVSNGVNTDETVLYFNANASDSFDQYDAQKRSNDDPVIPEIYTQIGSEQLVINGMNSLKYNTEIPLGFSTEQANSFSISANEMTNFEIGTRVILIDKLNPSVETELTNGAAYNFSAPITAATTGRFSLLFRAPGVATSVDNATKLNAQVFVNAANQITIIAAVKSNYAIYNAVGQKVKEGITTANRTIANGINDSGVYVVQVCENGRSNSTRVILNGK